MPRDKPTASKWALCPGRAAAPVEGYGTSDGYRLYKQVQAWRLDNAVATPVGWITQSRWVSSAQLAVGSVDQWPNMKTRVVVYKPSFF